MHQPNFSKDWFTHNESTWAATIYPHLKKISNPKVLEVGAFEGRASLWFLTNFSRLLLTVIDPWAFTNDASEDTYNKFQLNILPFKDRTTVLRGTSSLMRTLPDNEYDVIYIDGEHTSSAVLHDAVLAYELLKPDGLIVFDDYQGGDKSLMYPKPAVDFFHDAYGALSKIELVSDSYQRIYRKLIGTAPPQF